MAIANKSLGGDSGSPHQRTGLAGSGDERSGTAQSRVYWLKLEAALLGVGRRLDVVSFAGSLCRRRGHDSIHELQSGFGVFGHLIFELPRGEAGIAEEFGFLRPKLRQPGDRVARVVGVSSLGAVPGMLKNCLAGGAITE